MPNLFPEPDSTKNLFPEPETNLFPEPELKKKSGGERYVRALGESGKQIITGLEQSGAELFDTGGYPGLGPINTVLGATRGLSEYLGGIPKSIIETLVYGTGLRGNPPEKNLAQALVPTEALANFLQSPSPESAAPATLETIMNLLGGKAALKPFAPKTSGLFRDIGRELRGAVEPPAGPRPFNEAGVQAEVEAAKQTQMAERRTQSEIVAQERRVSSSPELTPELLQDFGAQHNARFDQIVPPEKTTYRAGPKKGQEFSKPGYYQFTDNLTGNTLSPKSLGDLEGELLASRKDYIKKGGLSVEQAELVKQAVAKTEAAQAAAAEVISPRGAAFEQAAKPIEPVAPKGSILADVDRVLTPEAKPKFSFLGAVQKIKGGASKIQAATTSEFTPPREAEKRIYQAIGKPVPPVNLARKFELVQGAAGKAEADLIEFDNSIFPLIKSQLKDFDRYLFMRRTLQRLTENPEIKKVADWTSEKAQKGLAELRSAIGNDKFDILEQTAKTVYQEGADKTLRLQVEAGKLSLDAYAAIKEQNDFYAPFKMLKYLEDEPVASGAGRNIATTKELTKKIIGIHSEDFKIESPLQALRSQIYNSRILAEKNIAMRQLDALADLDQSGLIVKRIADDVEPPKGYQKVPVFKDGEKTFIQVSDDVANAVKGLNAPVMGVLANAARQAATPFRWGATAANVPFQVVNFLIRDPLRQMFMSKYGLGSRYDILYPLDWLHSVYSAMRGNFGFANQTFIDYLKSGSAGATIQRVLTPSLRNIEAHPLTIAHRILYTIPELGNALEDATKILGFKRGLRIEQIAKLPPKQAAAKIQEIAVETRNYSGSPDFPQGGPASREMNVLFMFMKARLLWAAADAARLAGRTGGKPAVAAWTRLGTVVGVPTTVLWFHNNSEENRADYEQVPQQERDNYFMIPRNSYFADDKGNKIREYYRIPKDGMIQLTANLIEDGLHFAESRDPDALAQMGTSFLENISPINIQGKTGGERLESVIGSMNPLVKVPIEMGTGRNVFRHQPIVSEKMKNLPSELQYKKNTPRGYREMGKFLGVSPLYLQQAAEGFTGGFTRQFESSEIKEGRSAGTGNPLTKRFFRSTSVYAPQVDEFYKRYNTGEALVQQARHFLAKRDMKNFKEIAYRKDFREYITKRPLYSYTVKEIAQLRDAIDAMPGSTSSIQFNNQIKILAANAIR